jgi:glutaredoxin
MSWNWSSLWSWLWPPGRLRHWRVVLYTRRGCCLCDRAWALLRRRQRQFGFALEQADVDSDAEWEAKYGEQVPVVAVNGKVRFRGGVNPVLLARLFTAAEDGDGG